MPALGEPLSDLVARALKEDRGGGDLTSEAIVAAGARARARVIQKQPGVICGLAALAETLRQCGVERIEALLDEGHWREGVPCEVALASGPARALLGAERTALNFLGHLSGIATLTARYVRAVAGTGVQILDTRKTTPGLRGLEKEAVAVGGGRNHRRGLDDAILIKENHIALAGGLARAVEAARAARPGEALEVECRDLEEVAGALGCGVERLLLDNMEIATLRAAVGLRDAAAGDQPPRLEASGGVDLANVRQIAETGVELISVGALTHSAPSLDFSMLVEPA